MKIISQSPKAQKIEWDKLDTKKIGEAIEKQIRYYKDSQGKMQEFRVISGAQGDDGKAWAAIDHSGILATVSMGDHPYNATSSDFKLFREAAKSELAKMGRVISGVCQNPEFLSYE